MDGSGEAIGGDAIEAAKLPEFPSEATG